MSNVKNIHDLQWADFGQGGEFECQRKGLTDRSGSGLGVCALKLAPGKSAFPKHAHLTNDEAIFVLSGTGTMQMGDDSFEVKEGDYVPLPKGEAYAHKLTNTSDADLEYLCMSTMVSPEVVFYPDSNKTGIFVTGGGEFIAEMYDREPVDYWKGEGED